MAKKSVKLGLRSGATVESGDVNVTYNGVRIAGLTESTTATLQTEDTIVEHDIEIEYTKPAGGSLSRTYPFYETPEDMGAAPTLISTETDDVGDWHFIAYANTTNESVLYTANTANLDDVAEWHRTPCNVSTSTIGGAQKGFFMFFPNLDDFPSVSETKDNCFVILTFPK